MSEPIKSESVSRDTIIAELERLASDSDARAAEFEGKDRLLVAMFKGESGAFRFYAELLRGKVMNDHIGDSETDDPVRLVRKFRRGQSVVVDFRDGEPDENWTGIGKFVRHVRPDAPGYGYLTEPHAIVKTSEDDWGSVFPTRCISFPNTLEGRGCAAPPCSRSSDTPETDRIFGGMTATDAGYWKAVSMCRDLERQRNALRESAEEVRKRLDELPAMVLANEQKNPAWSKAELWGIERDIIPSVRALCWSASHLLPENTKS